MARATRRSSLETPTARADLARGKWHTVKISKGTALAYRRRGKAAGIWYVRIVRDGNRYTYRSLGEADDFRDANGSTILGYFEAQAKARDAADEYERERNTYTVRQAVEDYFAAYPGRQASVPRIRASVEPHILPTLGKRPVNALTTGELEAWRAGLVDAPARIRGKDCTREAPEDEDELAEYTRRRKATANRILGVLRAALNHVWRTREDVPINSAWAKVRPYRAVSLGRVDYLTAAEAKRLIAECPPDLRALIRSALLTGARPGELREARVEDFDRDHGTVYIRKPKVNHCRHVPLNAEGRKFFDSLTAGRDGAELMFLRADYTPWAKDDVRRPLAAACKAAKVKSINLYALRHTFATLLLAENVSMHYLAKLMGTSIGMIEAHYGHIVEELQRETVNKLPSFGLDDSKVARIA